MDLGRDYEIIKPLLTKLYSKVWAYERVICLQCGEKTLPITQTEDFYVTTMMYWFLQKTSNQRIRSNANY